jgi:hypothetical protein
MSGTKNQHYVPRSYLRNFAIPGTSAVWTLDKSTQKVFRANIEKVACERYFYDFPEVEAEKVGVDPQLIEHELARFEAAFRSLIQDTIAANTGDCRGVPPEAREGLAHLLTMQFWRTRESREVVAQTMTTMAQRLADLTAQGELHVEVNQEISRLHHLSLMFNPRATDELVNALLNHFWIVGINDSNEPLVTSDHPVVRYAHRRHPWMSYTGLASPGIEIAFPLNPRLVLILFERREFHSLAGIDGKYLPLNEQNVIFYNSLQIRESYRYVYSQSNRFDLAREVIAAIPAAASTSRPRVDVG